MLPEVTETPPTAEMTEANGSENLDENLENECIFDRETQTDEFIQNVEALKNYRWDDEEKVSYVTLYVLGFQHRGIHRWD